MGVTFLSNGENPNTIHRKPKVKITTFSRKGRLIQGMKSRARAELRVMKYYYQSVWIKKLVTCYNNDCYVWSCFLPFWMEVSRMPVTLYCMMGKQRADTCLFSSQVIRLKGKVLPELYPRDHIRIQDVLSSKTLHAGILANRPRLGVRCSQYQLPDMKVRRLWDDSIPSHCLITTSLGTLSKNCSAEPR